MYMNTYIHIYIHIQYDTHNHTPLQTCKIHMHFIHAYMYIHTYTHIYCIMTNTYIHTCILVSVHKHILAGVMREASHTRHGALPLLMLLWPAISLLPAASAQVTCICYRTDVCMQQCSSHTICIQAECAYNITCIHKDKASLACQYLMRRRLCAGDAVSM